MGDTIVQNRQTSAALERLARAMYRAWFVDFEPVKAKAAGATSFPSMPKEVFDALPTRIIDSDLGSVPEGWKVASLGDVAEVIMGTSPSGDTYNDEGIGTPLINGPVEFGEQFAVKSKWTTAHVRVAKQGDLVFCVRGSTTGRRVFADDTFGLGRGVCAIRGRGTSQPFVNQLIESELPRLLSTTTGSVFPSLSSSDIRDFRVLKPPEEVSTAFSSITGSLLALQNQMARESWQLGGLRDYLLPKLLSGEVRVREAERAVAEAV